MKKRTIFLPSAFPSLESTTKKKILLAWATLCQQSRHKQRCHAQRNGVRIVSRERIDIKRVIIMRELKASKFTPIAGNYMRTSFALQKHGDLWHTLNLGARLIGRQANSTRVNDNTRHCTIHISNHGLLPSLSPVSHLPFHLPL